MKSKNSMKWFSVGILALWMAGNGLAQSITGAPPAPPSASDQQLQARDLAGKRGQQQVDLFTGSFGYSVPIQCAPARNGSEPNLALTYSSGGDNGWCGVGWQLNLGHIERNTRDGFPIAYSTATPPAPMTAYDDSKGFLLNLFGRELKLFVVATNGSLVEYRAEVDTEFLRCFLDTTNNKWLVYDKSGNVYHFGSATDGSSKMSKTGWSGSGGTFRWALDQVVTATGDWTAIAYTTYNSEKTLYPTQITYNGHTNFNGYFTSAGGQNQIIFQTEVRTNDWHFSHRSGFRTEMDRRLTNILCQVGTQNVWQYNLRYGISPATGRSLLTNVIVSGFDANNAASVLLTNTFSYQGNANAVSFSAPVAWTNLVLTAPDGLSYYMVSYQKSGATVADLVDMDGDGLPDRVLYDSTTTPSRYAVQRNLGNGTFDPNGQFAFGPTSTGDMNGPSASNPIPGTTFWAGLNSPEVRLRDVNGDGLPDRVCDGWYYWYNNNTWSCYTNFDVMLNTNSGFAPMATWLNINPGPGPAMAGGDAGLYSCIDSGGVNVGFFDINGDGLPDRVMTPYSSTLTPTNWFMGPMTNFLVQFNTGTNFTPIKRFPYRGQNYNYQTSNNPCYYWAGIETPDAHLIDLDGDGLPDRVMFPMNPTNGHAGQELPMDTTKNQTIYYAVEWNNGYSFESTNTITTAPGAFDVWSGVLSQSNNAGIRYDAMMGLPNVGMFDVNGDGLPDRVMLNESTHYNYNQYKQWLVYLNNGHGFNTTPITVSNIYDQSYSDATTPNDPGWWGPESTWSGSTASGFAVTLMDINGDGLLDRVMAVDYNDGTKNYFIVQTNLGPFPDLLTGVNNGIGGTMSVTYRPSTSWNNLKDPANPYSGSTCPHVLQTVTSVIESDGINAPRTNAYSYTGGYYDGPRREFHGFAVVTNLDASLRKTITYFHQGGGRDYSALGEFQDPGSFAKQGMAYRTESYGTDALLYKMVINQINQTNIGSAAVPRYFPFVSQTFEYDYPGGGSPRITGTTFVYSPTADAKIFNLTRKVLWGEVTNIVLTSIATPTDVVSSDTKTNVTTYAALSSNSYILDHPDTVDLVDSGNNVIQETKYTYDQNSGEIATKLTRISAGNYATNSYGNYTTYGLVGQTTDPVGVVTTIAYDSTYNTYPATTTVGGSFTTTTSYDARSGLLASSKDPTGVTVTNTFDAFCRPVESDKIPVGGGSSIWTKKYSYPATLKSIVSGLATNYADVTINDGVGGVESRTYVDGLGRPVQTRTQGENGNYRVVSTAYDERGEAFLTTWPIFGTTASFSKPTSGMASWIGFDAAGRVATNRPVSVTFDSNGAFSSKTDSGGDTGTSPLGPRKVSYVNGTDPWWIICTDEDGKVRRYGLDAFGRTNQIQEVDGANTYTTTLKYDLANNLTNIVNANTQSIYYAYNDAGGLVAMADPHLGQWTYVRDYAGRLRVQTDARGNVVSNSYVNASGQQDPLGRLQAQTVFGTNYTNHVLVPAYTNFYVYDTNGGDSAFTVYPGLLYKVTDGEGWEKTGYDSRARVIKTARHLNINNQTYTNSYTFDDGNNVTSIAYPNSGPVITNLYFTGGSIKQVVNNASFSGNNYYTVSAANIDEFGHVTSFAYGSLTTTRSYYSTSKRLLTISAGSGGSVFNRTYTYTTNEDIASINGTGVTNVSVAYDNLHRIKSFTGTSGLSGNYGYDSVGNMTTNIESGSAVAYSYANPRKQAVRTAFGYTNLYDLCGNMIVRHGGLTNSQAMAYDADNRLKIFSVAGKVVVEYGYAADGTRLWKRTDQSATNVQVWIGNIYEEKGGKVLFHVFAGGQQVCTFETNSMLGGGSDSSTNVVGYYYHEDNLNSSSALSYGAGSQMGQQAEVNAYFPFGRTLTASPQASFQVSRRFTGQVFDGETGLYYYGARYFDPELGRFIQADTIIPDLSNPQSYNRYSYVLNNPLRYTDPTGHGPDDYTGASGRAMLQDEDAGATRIVQSARQSAGTMATVGRAVAEANPIVGAFNGAMEAGTGKDAMGSGATLSGKARVLAGVAAVASIIPGGSETKAEASVLKTAGKEAAEKLKGSYVHEFESGMKYVGKGTEKRMATSGKALETANEDVLKGSKLTPSNPNTDVQAFMDEAQKIRDLGGVPNKNLYNKINSPGEKMLPQPIKKEGQ